MIAFRISYLFFILEQFCVSLSCACSSIQFYFASQGKTHANDVKDTIRKDHILFITVCCNYFYFT